MGTHLRVLSEIYPMNTNMTGFRIFPKIFAFLCFGLKSFEGLRDITIFFSINWLYFSMDRIFPKIFAFLCFGLKSFEGLRDITNFFFNKLVIFFDGSIPLCQLYPYCTYLSPLYAFVTSCTWGPPYTKSSVGYFLPTCTSCGLNSMP